MRFYQTTGFYNGPMKLMSLAQSRSSAVGSWPRRCLQIFILGASLSLTAQATDSLQHELEAFVYEAVIEQHPEANASTIELQLPNAGLPACEQPEPFLPRANEELSGRVTLGVRCANDQQTRYLQANIELFGTYPVLNRDIARGETIRASDLKLTEGSWSALPRRAIRDKSALIDQEARRQLRAGQPVQQYEIQAVRVISRGDQVKAAVAGAGFEISRQGEALDHGSVGDQIRLRLPNREILDVTVTGPGQAQVKTGHN